MEKKIGGGVKKIKKVATPLKIIWKLPGWSWRIAKCRKLGGGPPPPPLPISGR